MLKSFLSENCDHPPRVLNQSKAPHTEYEALGKEQPLSLHRECCTATTRQHPQSLSAQHHCRTRGRLGDTVPAAAQQGCSSFARLAPTGAVPWMVRWRVQRDRMGSLELSSRTPKAWKAVPEGKTNVAGSWALAEGRAGTRTMWKNKAWTRLGVWLGLLDGSCRLLDHCSASSPAAFAHGIKSSAKFQVQGHTLNTAFNWCPRDYSDITSPLQNASFLTIIHK